jgi:signal transduction histidine kinase
MFELISLCFFVVLNVLIGFSVVARNYKDKSNLIFGGFITSGMGWAILNYMSNNGSHTSKLIGNRGAFTAGLCAMILLWFFSQFYPHRRHRSRFQSAVLLLSPLAIIVSTTPLLVASFQDQPNKGVTSIVPGPAYLPFLIYLATVFVLAIVNFRKSAKSAKGSLKQRIELIYIGIGASFIWGLMLSAALPFFTNNWSAAKYGPFGLLFLTGSIFYALTKHQLFDVRRVVLRSMSFFVAQMVVVAVYIGTLVTLGSLLLRPEEHNHVLIFTSLMAAGVYLTLPPLIRYFRRVTKSFFFSDSYDTQVVINNLTKALVGTIDVEELSVRSLNILNAAIRTRSAFLVTNFQENDQNFTQITIGQSHKAPRSLFDEFDRHNQEVYIADSENEDPELASNMLDAGIFLAVRLKSHDKFLGYLCFTEKLSGSLFSSQDINLTVIASSEIALALQNAQRYAEIELFNQTLKQRIEHATRDLRHSNEKLKALDETKDEFISMASHQLRTPLTSVKGYVSMVIEGDAGKLNSKQKQLLDQAFTSSQRMVYLIADLLNVSRLHSGKFIIERKSTQLADVVEGELHQLQQTAKGRNITISYDRPKVFPELMLDETKIRQVIMNFADNAMYYTPAGGKVKVELIDNGKSIEYIVTDNGIGVPKAAQHHLFTKFFRADNARNARPDGTGLGLFMAKKVVIAQGGAIIFKSEEGKGSTFGFTFPKNLIIDPAAAGK